MMEAAVVFPVIILAVITVVLVVMFFYSQMSERCNIHVFLRAEAGKLTEQTIYLTPPEADSLSDVSFYTDKKAIGGEVYGKKYLVMPHGGLLRQKGTFTIEACCHAVDGCGYVRYWNLVRGMGDGENQSEEQ